MEWWIIILLLFGSLTIIMALGMPVAFSFLLVDLVAMYVVIGNNAPHQLIASIFDSLTKFTLTPIPFFILMGEVLYHSGLAKRVLSAIDSLLGRLPGRLAILSIVSGTIFASLSGSVVANTVLLGSLLLPDMLERGYNRRFAIGSVMASGSLTMMMPHSTLIIIFATIAMIPVGSLLVAGLLPGLIIASLYFIYTIGRSILNPELAPGPKQVEQSTGESGLVMFMRDVLPLLVIIIATIAVIFFGIATPTEAAALGALCSVILVIIYGRLSTEVVKKSTSTTIYISAMLLFIMAGSAGFSQVLAFSGASQGLLGAVLSMNLSPNMVVISMLIIVFFIAMFMEESAIIMVATPIFMPVIKAMHVDPIWFGVLMLMMLEKGLITPPAGLLLYVAKGIAPKEISTWDIWVATIPYVICILIAIIFVYLYPSLATIMVRS